MANGLRPLYCPWPRCFLYHTIPFGAALALHCCALRGTSGGATMTYRSPGRFRFFHPPPARVLLMYTRATSLHKLYIRNIIPGDMASPIWSASPYRGGAVQTFTPA